MRNQLLHLVKLICFAILLSVTWSCTTTFGENHYFQATDLKTGEVSNYYRLTVKGYAFMSSARYVSGFYDERAVDMFFNEMKIADTKSTDTTTGKIFVDQQIDPGTQTKITPLSPTEANGAFVMILSSNASSVTNTIGQFAENQIVADAVTNLANRDLVAAELRANQATALAANATAQELQKLFALVPSSDKPTKDETVKAYLRILNSISRAINPDQANFNKLEEAEAWVSRVKLEM